MLPWLIFLVAIKYSYSQDEPASRIDNGRNTTIEQHPYFVTVETRHRVVSQGALIASNLVVTSAHLVQHQRNLYVRAGTAIRRTGGTTIPVTNVHIMDSFNPKTREYDIAVLVLQYNYHLGETINTIDLGEPAIDNVPVGFYVAVLGWGLVHQSGYGVLQMLNLQRVTCNDAPVPVPEHMGCYAIMNSYDRPSADAGSPLVVDNKLIAIDSWDYPYKPYMHKTVYMQITDPAIHDFVADFL